VFVVVVVVQVAKGRACEADKGSPADLFGDCIHPNPTGYHAIMDYM
jgi:hypothetical protein